VDEKPSQPQAKDKIAQSTDQQLKELPLEEVKKHLSSSSDVLSQADAQKRLETYGDNELPRKKAARFRNSSPTSGDLSPNDYSSGDSIGHIATLA